MQRTAVHSWPHVCNIAHPAPRPSSPGGTWRIFQHHHAVAVQQHCTHMHTLCDVDCTPAVKSQLLCRKHLVLSLPGIMPHEVAELSSPIGLYCTWHTAWTGSQRIGHSEQNMIEASDPIMELHTAAGAIMHHHKHLHRYLSGPVSSGHIQVFASC